MQITSNYNIQTVFKNLDPINSDKVHIFNEYKELLTKLKEALANGLDKEGAKKAAENLQTFLEKYGVEVKTYIKENCPNLYGIFVHTSFIVQTGAENYLEGRDSPGDRAYLSGKIGELLQILGQVK